MMETAPKYLPAAGHDLLLPLYDPLTALLGIGKLRRALFEGAELAPGQRVLDVGCGTGSLLVALKRQHRDVEAVGLDPDPKALSRATRKLRRAGVSARLERGYADALPFPDGSFDRVLSSFMFHHLSAAQQQAMLAEVRRVLAASGRLELVDLAGREESSRGRLARFIHSHEVLATNGEKDVLAAMQRAGFEQVRVVARRATLLGTIVQYRAWR